MDSSLAFRLGAPTSTFPWEGSRQNVVVGVSPFPSLLTGAAVIASSASGCREVVADPDEARRVTAIGGWLQATLAALGDYPR